MKLSEVLKKESIKDRQWLEEAKSRQANEGWQEISFLISLKILTHLREKQITQRKAAEITGCSPQYFNKLLKGKENLTIETIYKLEQSLGVRLIQIKIPT